MTQIKLKRKSEGGQKNCVRSICEMASTDMFNSSAMSNATSDESEPSLTIEAIDALPGDTHEIFGIMDMDTAVNNEGIIEGALEEPDSTLDNAAQLCKKCK